VHRRLVYRWIEVRAFDLGTKLPQPVGEDHGYGRRETVNLIGSDKVEGTAVYGADGNKIGSIERVMIDKLSGKVSYAVLSFGGILGIATTTTHCLGSRSTMIPILAGT
jgi:hypothetical protein